MNSWELIKMSYHNLGRRKLRTCLTILGVVIGTASIVVMLSLGIAMDRSFKEDLSRMGSLNTIQVYTGGYNEGSGAQQIQEAKLDDDAVKQFKSINGVEAVMAYKTAYFKIAAGKMVGSLPIMGINPEVQDSFGFETEEGRILLTSDKNALLFGSMVAYNFYNPRLRNQHNRRGGSDPPNVDLLNSRLLITSDMEYGERRRSGDSQSERPQPYEAKGVGILKQSNDEKDYQAYMNITALENIIREEAKVSSNSNSRRNSSQQNKYDGIKVKAWRIEDVEGIQNIIRDMGYQVHSLTDMLESMEKTSRTMQAILGAIGAVSLLVAAIGITNTMIMSIYERTREIGILKVIGADISDIKKLFLIEAGMIGLGGGLAGLGLSYTISFTLNSIAIHNMGIDSTRHISVIPLELALGGIAFATIIGLVSGYLPARRAMNLSALEAIRNE
ncbi:MAG: ABC transporter permease [Syntrophomonadaceae bacterium]|jgi:putative ABC transport system permease protein